MNRILTFILIIGLLGCKKTETSNDITYNQNFMVGSGGISYTDTSGLVKIDIPQNALGKDITIAFTPYLVSDDLASRYQAGLFSCGIDFGPDGTTFNKPITVQMEVQGLSKDSTYALFLRDNNSWVQQKQSAIAIANNKLSFTTSHFSSYAVFSLSGFSLYDFGNWLQETGNGQEAYNNLKTEMLKWMGKTEKFDGKMYEVCGIDFDVMYKYGTVEDQFVEFVGEKGIMPLTLRAEDDFMSNKTEIVYSVKVEVYWKLVPATKWHVVVNTSYENATDSPDNIEYKRISVNYSATFEFDIKIEAGQDPEVAKISNITYIKKSFSATVFADVADVVRIDKTDCPSNPTINVDISKANNKYVLDFSIDPYLYKIEVSNYTNMYDPARWVQAGNYRGLYVGVPFDDISYIYLVFQNNFKATGSTEIYDFPDVPVNYSINITQIE